MQFKNYWNFGTGINPSTNRISNSALRGGPSIYWPGNVSFWTHLGTDNRKKISAGFMTRHNRGYEGSSYNQNYTFQISGKPSNALTISLAPSLSLDKRELQYIKRAREVEL